MSGSNLPGLSPAPGLHPPHMSRNQALNRQAGRGMAAGVPGGGLVLSLRATEAPAAHPSLSGAGGASTWPCVQPGLLVMLLCCLKAPLATLVASGHLSSLLPQGGSPSSPRGLRTCTGWRRSTGAPGTPSPSPSPATPTTASKTQHSRSWRGPGITPGACPHTVLLGSSHGGWHSGATRACALRLRA